MHVIAVLGAGVMGETMLSGLLRSGRAADTLLIAEKRPARAAQLRELYGVEVVDPHQAAARADTLLLVVKPQDMGSLLDRMPELETLVPASCSGSCSSPTRWWCRWQPV